MDTTTQPLTRSQMRAARTALVEGYERETTEPGYLCKRCAGTAPMGVGFTSYRIGDRARSEAVTACECGYSVTAVR